MSKIILITGASSGFGRVTAEALALSGHTVYAGMAETKTRNAVEARKMAAFAQKYDVDLHTIELDLLSQISVDSAVAKILAATGRIDVLIHNAGHMAFGPAEAFTPQQLAEFYDVLGTQRVNRAVLPYMRWQKQGLVVWVPSSGSTGSTSPYFTTDTGVGAVAVAYSRELSRWGVETSIVVPGALNGNAGS